MWTGCSVGAVGLPILLKMRHRVLSWPEKRFSEDAIEQSGSPPKQSQLSSKTLPSFVWISHIPHTLQASDEEPGGLQTLGNTGL
jgi:hypothetical protein